MIGAVLLAAAVFVGNDACRPCHADLVRKYAATPMARSTAPVRGHTVPPGTFRHAPSNNTYTVTANGQVAIQHGRLVEPRRFDYVIGSGAAGFSYLIAKDRYLFQAPITWYSQTRRWDAAPGYESDPTMAWDRPIDPSCLQCHASRLTHIYGTVNRYAEQPFLQGGVGCERCHGAGSEHVRAGDKSKIVVPSRLTPEKRDDVCRQCHLMGEARIPRAGRTFAEYRPGERLADYVAYFVLDDPAGPSLRTTSHIELLNASRCKLSSGERLWCGTCHDVHTTPVNAASWYREKCLTCHAAAISTALHCNRGPDCITCHMPKSRATDAGHGAFTDHSIRRHPAVRTARADQPWRLRPFSPADYGDRELALAYAQLYQRTHDERQKSEALRIAVRGAGLANQMR